jgi:hypothetical protein
MKQLSSTTKAHAYEILGVSPNDVATCPQITPIILKLGGRELCLQYLRASNLRAARQFIYLYDDVAIPQFVRMRLPIEAFCLAAKIPPSDLISVIAEAAREVHRIQAHWIAAQRHPAIVEKSSELALAGDVDHATLNMKHMGFLPLPKGSQVSVNVSANAQAQSATQTTTVIAPSPEQTIRRIHDRFNAAREKPALPEPKETVPVEMPREAEAEYVDAEDGDEED